MKDFEPFPPYSFPLATEAEWRGRVDSVLKGADFDKKLVAHSHDGIRINPLYPAAKTAWPILKANAGQPWRVMARVDHPEQEEAASLALQDLEAGADALSLVFQSSFSARGYGLSCATAEDLDEALTGIRLDLIQTRLDPSPDGLSHAANLAALVARRGYVVGQMDIDFGLDPVGTLITQGVLPQSWEPFSSLIGKTVSALLEQGFKGPFLTVDLRPYHEAGASEGQELGAGLAQAVLYLRLLEAEGMSLDQAAQALSFILPMDADQFMGIVKLRALRKLWSKVESSCGLAAKPLMIHVETSWRMLTKRDPHVNILRGTVATFAAAIGGADSVTVLPFTSALGLPDAAARRLARNTSIVLQEESSLWRVADPAAGAGGYEALTNELAAKAWALFQGIEGEGGLINSLVAGKFQLRIGQTAKARAKAVATRKEPITGTSEFANLTEVTPDVLAIKPATFKAIPTGAARTSISPLPSMRLAEPFEALRDCADELLTKTGKRPLVTLVTMGALPDYAARLAFTRNAFEAGGLSVAVVSSASLSELPNEARLLCFVGSDALYAEEAAPLAQMLRVSNRVIWLAGRPGDLEASLTRAGITRFVFAGCDVVEILTEALHVSGS